MSHGTTDIYEHEQAATTGDDNRKECPVVKPHVVQIKLCDNGWIVGVFVGSRSDFYHGGCAPGKEFVFHTPAELANGIQRIVEGKPPAEVK